MLLRFILSIGLAASVSAGTVQIFFSPRGGCTEAVVKVLSGATNSIRVQAYSFTSVPIAKALTEAAKRGVKISVLLDKSQRSEKYSAADFLRNAGISTLIDDRHAIAHNKVMVIDNGVVITGSFNFTKAAEESNAENLLILRDTELAKTYLVNWRTHEAHSVVYKSKAERAPSKTKRLKR